MSAINDTFPRMMGSEGNYDYIALARIGDVVLAVKLAAISIVDKQSVQFVMRVRSARANTCINLPVTEDTVIGFGDETPIAAIANTWVGIDWYKTSGGRASRLWEFYRVANLQKGAEDIREEIIKENGLAAIIMERVLKAASDNPGNLIQTVDQLREFLLISAAPALNAIDSDYKVTPKAEANAIIGEPGENVVAFGAAAAAIGMAAAGAAKATSELNMVEDEDDYDDEDEDEDDDFEDEDEDVDHSDAVGQDSSVDVGADTPSAEPAVTADVKIDDETAQTNYTSTDFGDQDSGD